MPTPELAIIFRGESVSGRPGARGGPKHPKHRTDFFRFSELFGPPWAPGWPETDSPRKMIANSGVETEIRALGTRFVAIFRFAGEAKGRTGRVKGRSCPVKGRRCPVEGRSRPLDPKLIRHSTVC